MQSKNNEFNLFCLIRVSSVTNYRPGRLHARAELLEAARYQLTMGEDAMDDFDVLKDFQSQGFTDYLMTSSDFQIGEVKARS